MSDRYPQVGVRVDPTLREDIRAGARRYHDGSDSALMRAAARLYLALRQRFGVRFDDHLLMTYGVTLEDGGMLDPRGEESQRDLAGVA